MADNPQTLTVQAKSPLIVGADLLEHAHHLAENVRRRIDFALSKNSDTIQLQFIKLKADFAELQIQLIASIEESRALIEASRNLLEQLRTARR